MILAVIIVLVAGTVMQYHHHGHAHVCMCFNPVEHCDCHHQGDCDSACENGSQEDANECSLHLDYGLAGVHHQLICQPLILMAVLADRQVIDADTGKSDKEYQSVVIKIREGDRCIRCRRGPPMC